MKKRLALLLVLVVAGFIGIWLFTRGKAPPRELLARWWNVDNHEGIEFAGNGTLTITRNKADPLPGKYRFLEEGLMEVDLRPTVKEPVQVKVTLGPEELILAALLRRQKNSFPEEWASTWKRVPEWPLAPEADNTRTLDQRQQQLVGKWQSVADISTFDFYDDRTFARFEQEILWPVMNLGTYHLEKDSPHELRCSYPDNGATETLYYSLGPEELIVGRDHPDCPLVLLRAAKKYRRAGDPTPEYRPLRPDVLTAYQLHLEWQTDPVAAEKKYQGQKVQVVGMVASKWLNRGRAMWHDENGKKVQVDGSRASLFLVTGAGQDVLCRFELAANTKRIEQLFFSKERTPDGHFKEWPRNKPVVIKGQCLGFTKDQGDAGITVDGNAPKVRLDHCTLVEDTPPAPG